MRDRSIPDFDEFHTADEVRQHSAEPVGAPPTTPEGWIVEGVAIATGLRREDVAGFFRPPCVVCGAPLLLGQAVAHEQCWSVR